LTPGSNTPAVSRLKSKEGRILQADPRFQAISRLADWTRKKTQGGIQGAQRPRQKTIPNQWFTATRPTKAAEYN
jgi:hypothetical protein